MSESRVYLRVRRVAAEVAAGARETSVVDVHEAMGIEGRGTLMSARMRPLTERPPRIAGPAVTASCWPGDNLMMHRALVLAQPGDVLVVVCREELSAALWGDMASRYALRKGLAGVIVQGCVRDVDVVRELGFPVWSTHVWAMHPDKSGHGTVNAPLVCDGARVAPGDLIVADGDGVVCVPRDDAARVVEAARARTRKEEEKAAQVLAGASLWELSGAAASYARLGVREIDAAWDDRPAG